MQRSLRAERPIVIRNRPRGKWSAARSRYVAMSSDILLETSQVVGLMRCSAARRRQRTFTNDNCSGNHIVQTPAPFSQGGNKKTKPKDKKRYRISDKMSHQRATNAHRFPVYSFNSESGGPLSQRPACQTRYYTKIKDRRHCSRQDADRFCGGSGTASAAAKHPGHQGAQHNDGHHCYVVDQKSATTKSKRSSEAVSFCSWC